MGIQINGQTDTITAIDGELNVSGADLGSASAGSLNVTGIVTASGFSGTLSGNVTGNVSGNVTGNISAAGVSTFSGGVVVASGSTSAPSISPTSDSNTGIFFPSPDTVAIAEGGVEVLRVNSSGNLGIATNNPFAKTHIEINAAAGAGSGSAGALWLRNSNQTANNSATIFAGNNSSQASAAINFIHENYTTNAGVISFDTRTNASTYAERFRIDSSGRVIMPYQPSFSVWFNGSQNIAHATATKVQFNTEVFDVGGNFDSSINYRFTAPVAGKYLFMGHLYIYSVYLVEVYIYKNGSSYKRFSGPIGTGGNDNPNGQDFLDVIDLAVNDYVEIYGYQSRTGDTAAQLIYGGGSKETSFVGYLIG